MIKPRSREGMRACIPRHAPGCVIPRAGGFNHRENERGLEREREGWWRRWRGHHRHFRNYARRILIKNAREELRSTCESSICRELGWLTNYRSVFRSWKRLISNQYQVAEKVVLVFFAIEWTSIYKILCTMMFC